MLSLVYEGSRDEDVYDRLSERMRDRFDIFGQLPDVLEDDWISDRQHLDEELNKHIERRRRANAFDMRWGGTATGETLSTEQREWQEGWERCAKVLARQDLFDALGKGW